MKIACSPLLYTQSVPLDSCPEVKMQTEEIFRIILTVHKIKQGLGIHFFSILKSRRVITLPTKVHLVKAMGFPVVIYGCESWTIKKLSIEELMLLNCDVGEDS